MQQPIIRNFQVAFTSILVNFEILIFLGKSPAVSQSDCEFMTFDFDGRWFDEFFISKVANLVLLILTYVNLTIFFLS
jgi:hypothetical protein